MKQKSDLLGIWVVHLKRLAEFGRHTSLSTSNLATHGTEHRALEEEALEPDPGKSRIRGQADLPGLHIRREYWSVLSQSFP
ncbi:MAG TPA: hypothetical protein DDY88_00060, partial [Actinobacteria bacterium]|nr:hypothetical protein [Actinomycetota bacterium]